MHLVPKQANRCLSKKIEALQSVTKKLQSLVTQLAEQDRPPQSIPIDLRHDGRQYAEREGGSSPDMPSHDPASEENSIEKRPISTTSITTGPQLHDISARSIHDIVIQSAKGVISEAATLLEGSGVKEPLVESNQDTPDIVAQIDQLSVTITRSSPERVPSPTAFRMQKHSDCTTHSYFAGVAGKNENDDGSWDWIKRVKDLQSSPPNAPCPHPEMERHVPLQSFISDLGTNFTEESECGGVPLLGHCVHQQETNIPQSVSSPSVESLPSYTSYDELDHDFDIAVTEHTFELGLKAFHDGDFRTAYNLLQEKIELAFQLPDSQRHIYDAHMLQYVLAVCALHVRDAGEAEAALRDVVEKATRTTLPPQLLDIYRAGHLLAQAQLKLPNLDAAYKTCKRAMRSMYKLLDKMDQAYLQSLALFARIHELQGRPSRAYVYAEMIPQDFRNSFMSPYRHLILGNAEQPGLEAPAVQLPPSASDQSERTPINTPKSSN